MRERVTVLKALQIFGPEEQQGRGGLATASSGARKGAGRAPGGNESLGALKQKGAVLPSWLL